MFQIFGNLDISKCKKSTTNAGSNNLFSDTSFLQSYKSEILCQGDLDIAKVALLF